MLRGQNYCHSYISLQKIIKPDFDPELAVYHSTYGDFLTRMHAVGMFRCRASHKNCGALGFFFVRKKDDSLRFISDTRKLIMRFKEPPKTELLTASAVFYLVIYVSGCVYLGSGDIKKRVLQFESPQCFSQLVHFSTPLSKVSACLFARFV